MNKHKLIEQCALTLRQNDLGAWTRPAPGLYPHQWLWDSCFIAIGLSHVDAARGQVEIDSLFRGQWKNGMIPHIIHGSGDYYADKLWQRVPHSDMPQTVLTSGITQPPLLCEAMTRVGSKMLKTQRIEWYKSHFNQLLAYHEWLYRERDPEKTGLVALVHPWESGIDNSPAWMQVVHQDHWPLWIKLAKTFGLSTFLEQMRRDTRYVPANERIDTIDALLLFYQARRLHKYGYQSAKILKHSHIATQDVLFNSILIRANSLLKQIAQEINADVPAWLEVRMKLTARALPLFWDTEDHTYYDRDYKQEKLLKTPCIGRYLPLYSGSISQAKADLLAKQVSAELLATPFPVASVPTDSPFFNAHRYWQGPSWVNTNWLIADGLERYGHRELAGEIREKTLLLIDRYGSHEYFSPIDGSPAGAHQFSWSAALAIDFANQ